MPWPNFLLIGACKAGTTSLYHYLGQHPQVFVSPVKEPKFFAYLEHVLDVAGPGDQTASRRVVTRDDDYQRLFDGVSGELAIGEGTCMYLYSESAPRRIAERLPDAKLIAILRHPVERAYSAYLHQVRARRERLGFAEALAAEEERIGNNWNTFWHYRRAGFYAIQLKRFLEHFDSSQIRVYLHEDWRRDNLRVLDDVFRFLEVDTSFRPNVSMRYQVAGVPWSRSFHRFLTRRHPLKDHIKQWLPSRLREYLTVNLERLALRSAPPLPARVRQTLLETYRDDIVSLQALIDRDLSGWLTPPAGS